MLISFSGAQSTGKTTLLDIIQKCPEYSSFTFIDEVTRRLRREQGIPINDDADDYSLTQRAIIGDHMKNVCLENAILDRCILDGLVYTQYFFRHGKVSGDVMQLATDMYYTAMPYYDIIFVTDPKDVPLIDDGERSADVSFRDEIIELFDQYRSWCSQFEHKFIDLSGNIEDRLHIIKTTLAKYGTR